jgi:hypothetical protein
MQFIRMFLWGLVGGIMLHGALYPEAYHQTSLISNLGLIMTAWGEQISRYVGVGMHVPLPRALVVAALQESARHPRIHAPPKLQASLQHSRRLWDGFRDLQASWMLRHAAFVGALENTREGRAVWEPAHAAINQTMATVAAAEEGICRIITARAACRDAEKVLDATREAHAAALGAWIAWTDVFRLTLPPNAKTWWAGVAGVAADAPTFAHFAAELGSLHDVMAVDDARVQALLTSMQQFAARAHPNPWVQRTLATLLEGDLWWTCMEHVLRREGRLRELMAATGVEEMMNAHERAWNTSLRMVPASAEDLVRSWFNEIAGYAWWLGDDVPVLVRRCVGQQTGECRLIGPAEIAALRQARAVLDDWGQRILIGMWSTLPALMLLVALELVVMCAARPKREFVVVPRLADA